MKNIIGSIHNDTSIKLGVIKYSSRVYVEVNLKDMVVDEMLINSIDDMSYTAGLTSNLTGALQEASTKLETKDEAKPSDIIILVTFGKSSSPISEITDTVNKIKRDHKVNIISIGIGNLTNEDEMHAIASDPIENNHIHLDSVDELDKSLKELEKQVCDNKSEESNSYTGLIVAGAAAGLLALAATAAGIVYMAQ